MSDQFTPEALELWNKVPSWAKDKILTNVWCRNCKITITIVNYSGEVKGSDLVLTGTCRTCGSKVARLLESE
jgi:hypothetical protein